MNFSSPLNLNRNLTLNPAFKSEIKITRKSMIKNLEAMHP